MRRSSSGYPEETFVIRRCIDGSFGFGESVVYCSSSGDWMGGIGGSDVPNPPFLCGNILFAFCYRPQTKLWEGNVFTLVCDSVHRVWSLSMGGLCPGVSVRGISVRGISVRGVSVREGLYQGGVSIKEGSLSRGSLSRGSLSQGGLSRRPPYQWKSRWYTSNGRSRVSPRRGRQLPGGCQHMILPNFPKNCMKLKETVLPF